MGLTRSWRFDDVQSTDCRPFYSPAMERSHFSYPIASITPMIQDDCTESPEISVSINGYDVMMQDGVKYTLGETAGMPDSAFGFTSILSYQNPCNVAGMWFDMEFAHHAEQMKSTSPMTETSSMLLRSQPLICLAAKRCLSVQRMRTTYTTAQKHAP